MKQGLIYAALIGLAFLAGVYFNDSQTASDYKENHTHQNTINQPIKTDLESASKVQVKGHESVTMDISNEPMSDYEVALEDDHVSANLKNRLCINQEDNSSCIIDLNKNIAVEIFDRVNGAAKSDEISAIISSVNYQEVLNHMSTEKLTDEAYIREEKLNSVLTDIIASTTDLSSQGISCNDKVCGLSVYYSDEQSITQLKKELFTAKNNTGSLFIANVAPSNRERKEMRAFFTPGANGVVVRSLKK